MKKIDSFQNRLKEAIEKRNIKKIDLADRAGINRSAINHYLTGMYEAKQDNIYKFSKILRVSPEWLMGYDFPMEQQKVIDSDKLIGIPILGRIPAGTPIEAIEEIVGHLPIKKDKLKYAETEYFCLEVQGDSMLPTYKNGDIVLFHKTNTAENGEDVAIMINGFDATFKKFYRYNDKVVIQPINPEFKTQEFTPEEVESLPVTILGKAISFTRDI